jgi:6-pyruvoyltetrahydropterin/6-carboxytetrahydropterin synthase
MKWTISKEFEFDYGHRVWTQKLNQQLSGDPICACRFLHGHRGKLKVYVESTSLNEEGMVIDFKNLNFVKKILNEYFDHKFIVDINDPVNKYMFSDFSINKLIKGEYGMYRYNTDTPYIKDNVLCEYLSGFTFLPIIPTSEKLAEYFTGIIDAILKEYNVKIMVEFFETPSSSSKFSN